MRRKKRRIKKFPLIVLLLIIIAVSSIGYITYKDKQAKNLLNKEKSIINGIKNHFSNYVITTKETKLYDASGKEIGAIGKDITLSLEKTIINKDTQNFKLTDFEDTYISYKDVNKIDKLKEKDNRYKVYIPFNLNIKTKEKTSFYNESNDLVYTFNKSYDLPIIVKDTDKYGVEFQDELLYVKKDDVDKTYEHHNTDKHNSSGIGVLNYHAFYDENNAQERSECNTVICHSKSQFKSHLDYFKSHNMLTVKMKEVEMYVDKKIQLPKSVLITIDDGGRTKIAIDMLNEYKMYATIFVVTSWFDPNDFEKSDYVELHSHSHHMHETGACPQGQGGGIQCLSEEKIQEDLKISREKLNNTTYFCYPFYEYNEYSIRMLKQAGFTMAFDGEKSYGDNLVHPGDDKFRLRRFVIVTYTTLSDFDTYFGGIK